MDIVPYIFQIQIIYKRRKGYRPCNMININNTNLAKNIKKCHKNIKVPEQSCETFFKS
jgi:hypothetical protein